MVHRRDLVLLLVAASLLLLPASAGAAPQWRPAETTEAAGSAIRVATDSGGNSVAVWEITGRVLAS